MAGLVIHIGDCKAGSTSIQQVMASGGWHAPDAASIAYARSARRRAAHHVLADSLFMERRKPKLEDSFAALATELAAAKVERLAVSTERFEFADPHALAAAMERHMPGAMADLRLIAYVRPHGERVVSGYAQRTKLGRFEETLDAFHEMTLKRGGFLFAPRLIRWREVFGDRLTVRPMIRDRLLKRCVVHDFIGWATGTAEVSVKVPTEANASIPLEDLAVIRELRHAGWPPKRQNEIYQQLSVMMEQEPVAGTKPRLHRALAEKIARDYAGDAAGIDATFCGGEPVFASALSQAIDNALPEPQAMDAADLLPPETQRIVRLMSRLLVRTVRKARAGVVEDEDD
jgi:hypothetical protein